MKNKLICFLKYVFIIIIFIHFSFSLFNIFTSIAPDFHEYYISAKKLINVKILNSDKHLYNGYPLFQTVFFIPFVFLPYFVSQGLFILLNIISLLMIVFFTLKMFKTKIKLVNFFFLLSMIIVSFPFKFTIGMGQINLISSAFLILSFYLYKNRRNFLSGIFLAFAIWTKPYFAIMSLFYLLEYKKNLKILYTTLLSLFFILIISFVCFGLNNITQTLNSVPILLNFDNREIYYNQGFMGFISRFISNDLFKGIVSFITALFLIACSIKKSINNKEKSLQFSLFITTILLINPLSWQHHFIYLIFPFIIVFYKLKKCQNMYLYYWFWFSYLLISSNIKNPYILKGFFGNIIISHVFIGALIFYFLIFYLLKRPKFT
jgi:hypothetical protein